MYTSMLIFVLAVQSAHGAISWSDDYGQAQRQGQAEKKPLAVVFGSGSDGYNQLVRNGGMSKDASDLLSTHYVCVYIDTDTPKGKELATAFEMPSQGIVLSDPTGVYERFRQEGTIINQLLVSRLQQYNVSHTAASSASEQTGGAYAQPAAGSYCPTCNGGGRRR